MLYPLYYVLSSDPRRSLFLGSGIALWNMSAPSPIGLWRPCLESILLRSSAPLPMGFHNTHPKQWAPQKQPFTVLVQSSWPVCVSQAYSRCGLAVLFRLIYILDIVYISTHGPALFCLFVCLKLPCTGKFFKACQWKLEAIKGKLIYLTT